MIEPSSTPASLNAGEVKVITLSADARRSSNIVTVSVGTTGVLSFRHKALYGQWATAEAPNTLDMASKNSIMFNGVSLEALEITNSSASPVTVVVTQF